MSNPDCFYCHSSDAVTTAPINGNPTWKCKSCGGLFSVVKRTPTTVTLGKATQMLAQYISMNIEKGLSAKDAVYNACRTLDIKLSSDRMDNLIDSIMKEQERLKEAKDLGMDVAAGQVIQKVDKDEHDEMLKKATFINDSFSVRRIK